MRKAITNWILGLAVLIAPEPYAVKLANAIGPALERLGWEIEQ